MIGRGRNLSQAREEIRLRVRGGQASRLDLYLKEKLAWKSRTRLQRLIELGRVAVNGRLVKPSYLVRPGDEVVVRLSLGTGIPDYGDQEIDVLYEDPWLLAINKAPGMLVHPVGRHVYDTLMNYLHYRYRQTMTSNEGVHLRLCHRLDKDTSGVLLVGKDDFVHQAIQWQLAKRTVSKEYLTLVSGHVPEALEEIDRPLREGRDLDSALSGPGLKPSMTQIAVLERFRLKGVGYSWLTAKPVSGRQNQIRVHLASVGHPLLADERYGGTPAPGGFPARFILHAHRLRFYLPRLKSSVELEATLPKDVEDLLARLRS